MIYDIFNNQQRFLPTPSARRATDPDAVAENFRHDFYPRPPRGGRPGPPARTTSSGSIFLPTPSARRATSSRRCTTLKRSDFYPRPPRGGRRISAALGYLSTYFYPRPPRGGRLRPQANSCSPLAISTHALREEGDAPSDSFSQGQRNFYPRPPRGGRLDGVNTCKWLTLFLPTPSARRATETIRSRCVHSLDFYPRPPRGGRRGEMGHGPCGHHFYPRPPRGGRPRFLVAVLLLWLFLPTPSARRATVYGLGFLCRVGISTHALREEGDKYIIRVLAAALISTHALREEGDSS